VEPQKRQPKLFTRDFSPTPLGYLRWKRDGDKKLSKASWLKWRPTILRLEELRVELLDDAPWCEIDEKDLSYGLWRAIKAECRGRNGKSPSSNTVRGRYDAMWSYYEFLVDIGALKKNPLTGPIERPSGVPRHRPFLERTEDEALSRLRKSGHEIAVHALARGCGLREGEIVDLEDDDVDFANDELHVRKGKTAKATRTIPMTDATRAVLLQYRNWRIKNVRSESTKFVRTSSGTISKGYIWKLVKEMAIRAEIRVSPDPQGRPNTTITPHALRRTFGSALINAGVDTALFSPTLGHSSPRVTQESYALPSNTHKARRALLEAGDDVLALAVAPSDLQAALAKAKAAPAADVDSTLRELEWIQTAAAALEATLRAQQVSGARAA
jgi:integrase